MPAPGKSPAASELSAEAFDLRSVNAQLDIVNLIACEKDVLSGAAAVRPMVPTI